MELRLIERMAMLKAFAAVANADDNLNNPEIQLLTNIANNMDLDEDKVNAAFALRPDEASYVISNMEPDKKQLFYELMKETVFADKEANQKEVDYANNILKATGIIVD